MSSQSKIEWTNASWNPVTGCTEVSPGCDHCYARTFAERWRGTPGHPYEQGFDVKLWPERLALPSKWKKPQRIFVNSMSDLFHKEVPDDFILSVFNAMMKANHHLYQVLTKRPSRLVNTLLTEKILSNIAALTGKTRSQVSWPAHIWLGVSVENQDYTWRVNALRRIDAPVRFLSCEPLLGPLRLNLDGIKWVIAGAESGHGARPMDENWIRNIRDRCISCEVAFFYKQNARNGKKIPMPELDGKVWNEFPALGSEVQG